MKFLTYLQEASETANPDELKTLLKELKTGLLQTVCADPSSAGEEVYRDAQISAVAKDLRHRGDEMRHLVNVPKRFYSDWRKYSLRNAKHRTAYGSTSSTKMSPSSYHVESGLKDAPPHLVEINLPRCDCWAWRKRRYLCPHLVKLIDEGEVKWEELPQRYREHPYFNLDRLEEITTPGPLDPLVPDPPEGTARPETPVNGEDVVEEADFIRDEAPNTSGGSGQPEQPMDPSHELIDREYLHSYVAAIDSNMYHDNFFKDEEGVNKFREGLEQLYEESRKLTGAKK